MKRLTWCPQVLSPIKSIFILSLIYLLWAWPGYTSVGPKVPNPVIRTFLIKVCTNNKCLMRMVPHAMVRGEFRPIL